MFYSKDIKYCTKQLINVHAPAKDPTDCVHLDALYLFQELDWKIFVPIDDLSFAPLPYAGRHLASIQTRQAEICRSVVQGVTSNSNTQSKFYPRKECKQLFSGFEYILLSLFEKSRNFGMVNV